MSKENRFDRFRVRPGSSVRLDRLDTGYHGQYSSEASAAADTAHHLSRITGLQRKLYADRTRALLIVLQGIDGAGKDGTCWHVISAMDPQGVHVTGFRQPTPLELAHHFLWRVEPHAPWFIIPSDKKWYRNLAIAKIIADALEDMHLQLPEPTVDIEDIRRRYHAEAVAQTTTAAREGKTHKGGKKRPPLKG